MLLPHFILVIFKMTPLKIERFEIFAFYRDIRQSSRFVFALAYKARWRRRVKGVRKEYLYLIGEETRLAKMKPPIYGHSHLHKQKCLLESTKWWRYIA